MCDDPDSSRLLASARSSGSSNNMLPDPLGAMPANGLVIPDIVVEHALGSGNIGVCDVRA